MNEYENCIMYREEVETELELYDMDIKAFDEEVEPDEFGMYRQLLVLDWMGI